jgi:predicted enzyme related to lactoylglutathione lyase/cold shock CspA family protein
MNDEEPVDGVVSEWNVEEGWGVIASLRTPGGCWCHFSYLSMEGFRTLTPGARVRFFFERAEQDGYSYRAIEAWPEGDRRQVPPSENAGVEPLSTFMLGPNEPAEDYSMRASRITANLQVADLGAATSFYRDYLGLATEEFNLGWVARFTSPDTGASVQLVTADATAPEMPVVSVHASEVDEAYLQAVQLGYEIVHPLTTESWGVRRFMVRDPDGNVVNVVEHRE